MDLENGFRDSKIYECERFSGKLVHVPRGNGFNFGYVLFIPNSTNKNTTMIIEGANDATSEDFNKANQNVLSGALSPSGPGVPSRIHR